MTIVNYIVRLSRKTDTPPVIPNLFQDPNKMLKQFKHDNGTLLTFTQHLHYFYTMFTQCLYNVYTTFTQRLHYFYTLFIRIIRIICIFIRIIRIILLFFPNPPHSP